jgi:hypothetical protein
MANEPVVSKPIYQSKTFWVQVLAVVALVVPASSQFISEHLGASGGAWAFINIVLRMISKDKVEIV